MDSIYKLTEKFKNFPGIGERQAKRFVYFLLHKNNDYIKDLGESILELKSNISQCPSCFIFFPSNNHKLCDTCNNQNRDRTSLLVVEKDVDCESIKKSKIYNGLYFILGGLIPIVTKETPNFVRIKELTKTVEERARNDNLKEIILALSINPQAEHTDLYLREILNQICSKYNISIVSLGRGLSTGTELEYSDSETIKNALKNRQ